MLVVRAYHDLAWLAQVWNVRLADIAYLGENDLLRLSIRVFDEPIRRCRSSASKKTLPQPRTFSGLLGVRSSDVFAIFRDGDAFIDLLIDTQGDPVRLLTPQFVLIGDLVVNEAERQRFERLHPNLMRDRVSEDSFRCFSWEGRSYSFTSLQARFLHRLHDAGLTAQPWLNGKSLLAEIGSALVKPGDLFRRNPQWRDIVDHDQRGNYRLQPSFMAHPPW
jgi:hypothetical protein